MGANAGKHYSYLIPKQAAEDMLRQNKFNRIDQQRISAFMEECHLDPADVQSILDEGGISQKGYNMLYQAVAKSCKKRKHKVGILPNPRQVNLARKKVNMALLEKLGTPFHIQATFSCKERVVVFNEYNNLFVDLENLQKFAVNFFDIRHEECGGKLKFVLKLDECEILKNKKMERVTITLMNRVLDQAIAKDDPRYFSVQSENNILSLGSFEVTFFSCQY